MNEHLQRAIDTLSIQDVFVRSSVLSIENDFDPKFNCDLDSLGVQFKHLVRKHEVLKLENDGESLQVFRVHIELGARWVCADESSKKDENDLAVVAFIETTMVAEYLMQDHPGSEALEIFALRNASYHVWPYWREYLMNQAMRMNLPKTVLPAVQFAANSLNKQD